MESARSSEPPATAPGRGRVRRWLGWGLLALIVLTLGLLLMGVLLQQSVSDVAALASTVHTLKRFGVAAQVGLVVWIAIDWRRIVNAGVRRRIVAAHELEKALALRWTVVAFLAAYLLLVPIGPVTLFRFLVH